MRPHDRLFSVTVPAFKAQYLSECIDSILAQTYKNFEVIIVNDASPQNLDSIVSKYDDPRIHYYKNKVGFGAKHVVGNWNKCLEYAKGDYVICMGDDDKLLPNCLEEYAKLIEKYPGLNVYHALTEMIDENSNFMYMQEARPEREGVYSMMYGRLKNGRVQYIGDWLFKTDWLNSLNYLIWVESLVKANLLGLFKVFDSVFFQHWRNSFFKLSYCHLLSSGFPKLSFCLHLVSRSPFRNRFAFSYIIPQNWLYFQS